MKPKLTADRLREILVYNHDTGLFQRIKKFTNGGTGWKDKNGYLYIMIDAKTHSAHRLAWLYMTNNWPEGEIDHINGNKSDNRFCNLRDVSRRTNMQNERVARANGTSGFLGVYFRKERNKWIAQLRVDGKQKRFGSFNTPEEAHQAYLKAKRIHHEGCTI